MEYGTDIVCYVCFLCECTRVQCGSGTRRTQTLDMARAPRQSTRGKVLVFQDGCLKQTLQGEQVGSYLGSELCPLDVNYDGVTGLLLVGAPFYHIQGEEGRVCVYRLETEMDSFTLKGHLNVQVTSPSARFGFTVPGVGNITGDGSEDIAVGAPLLLPPRQVVPLLATFTSLMVIKTRSRAPFLKHVSC
ncbi:integrin alpha-E [Athene cunicularia]|uniref:integrin alpha-E n=1 Tax=Athene cunicularia TaxID=194338 RepID=UPI000EF6C52C|nr:integrin alpha-E [Athene cunicularia]